MNEIQNTEKVAKDITDPQNNFKGYTLEEIRYQRALVALQKEFSKTKIIRTAHNITRSNPLAPSASSMSGKVGFVASKLLTGLNYLDYAMIGFSVFGTARKVFSFFRKKK